MSKFDDIIREMKRCGDEHPFQSDFTQRTLEKMAAIRPFAAPAEPVPAPSPLWRRWWVPAAAVAVVLVILASWYVSSTLHLRGHGEVPSTKHIAPPSQHKNVTDALQIQREKVEPLPADEKSYPKSLLPLTPTSSTTLPVPKQDGQYAPDPSFIQPDQRHSTMNGRRR